MQKIKSEEGFLKKKMSRDELLVNVGVVLQTNGFKIIKEGALDAWMPSQLVWGQERGIFALSKKAKKAKPNKHHLLEQACKLVGLILSENIAVSRASEKALVCDALGNLTMMPNRVKFGKEINFRQVSNLLRPFASIENKSDWKYMRSLRAAYSALKNGNGRVAEKCLESMLLELDTMCVEKELDEIFGAAIAQDMEEMFGEEAPIVPVSHQKAIVAMSKHGLSNGTQLNWDALQNRTTDMKLRHSAAIQECKDELKRLAGRVVDNDYFKVPINSYVVEYSVAIPMDEEEDSDSIDEFISTYDPEPVTDTLFNMALKVAHEKEFVFYVEKYLPRYWTGSKDATLLNFCKDHALNITKLFDEATKRIEIQNEIPWL